MNWLWISIDADMDVSAIHYGVSNQRAIKRLFVILSAAKNLSLKAAEILYSEPLSRETG